MLSWKRAGRLFPPIPFVVAILAAGAAVMGQPAGRAEAAATSPWPSALHDSTHSATARVQGPTTGRIEWTRNLGSNITPGPVAGSDGTIYVATDAGDLYALNPTTGATQWTFDGGGPFTGGMDLSVSPLVLSTGSILWPGPKGTLYELTAAGQKAWSHVFGGTVLSPVASGQSVYVMTMAGTLSKLQLGGTTPSVSWSIPLGHVSYGSPVVSPDGDVITTVDRSVVAVVDHGTTPTVHWRVPSSATIEVSASVARSGEVFASANDASVYSIEPGGSLRWRKIIGHESYSSSTVTAAGLLYIGDNAGVLNIVRASNGAVVNRDHGVKGLWGAQVIDDRGDVYFGTQGKGIYGYSKSGHRLFHLESHGPIDSYPALTGTGTLIIGDESGTLYAIG